MNHFFVKHKKFYSAILVFTLAFYSLFGSLTPVFATGYDPNDENIIELKVLHTNDIHAKIDDFGKISAYIEAVRGEATRSLYLDAGDIFSGNPVVDLNYGVSIIDLLNDMGLDAMAIGNHDFDYGQEEAVKRIKESQFSWLSANTTVEDTPIPFPQPEPYKIFNLDGLKVGVFALTETPPSTAPANVVGITFEDPIETAMKFAYLKDEVDVLIALTHQGYSEDRKLAEAVDFFDVIIGGHSHTTLSQPAVVNGTPIVQTGGNAENVGNLSISFNSSTNEVLVSGFLQKVNELVDVNPAIQAKVDAYNAEMDELLSEVIGVTETGLNRSGSTDTSLGNFWTDSIGYLTGADIALTNNGGIRANIPAGDITVNDIYTIEPFANEIMKIEMTGEAIKDVIEYSYTRGNRNRIDLQTSGLTYNIITNNAGQYIDAQLYVNGKPIIDNASYIVSVGDYIGTGGSGYNFVGNVLEAKSGFMTEAMIKYAKYLTENNQAINYEGNQRISLIKASDAPIVGNVIGFTEKGLTSDNGKHSDSSLGNLYADSVRYVTDADFGMLNSSSVTGRIPAGDITDAQIQALDQFGNETVVVKTNAQRIKEVLLEQAKYHNGVDLQVSGFHYELIKENGQFTSIKLMHQDGTAIDEAKEYTVAYNDFMHGRGFYNLGDELVGGNYGKVWEAVVTFVENHEGPIDYDEGSRITIQGAPKDEVEIPDGVLTIAQAKALFAQTPEVKDVTVQGYIVGSNNAFDSGFVASNIILADSTTERVNENTMPIQLVNGTSIRTALNLQDNPANLGKLVRITGDLSAYFSRAGLRAPSSYEFIEVENGEMTLAEVRKAAQGDEVTTTGIVTSTPGAWGQKGFYIQDETAGIYVFQNSFDVQKGDRISITGKLGEFGQELQIVTPTTVDVISSGNELPEAKQLTPKQVTTENEGQLIVLEGVTISGLKSVNSFGTFEFNAVKGEESVVIRVDNRTGLKYEDFTFNNGDVVTIYGVSSRFNDVIQVKPRSVEDIIEFVKDDEPVKDYLTVAEAIANNSGQGTVQGYIIGTMTNNLPSYDGNFVTTNLVIADRLDERDRTKVLPVQLPNTAIRSALNLVDNPENYGKLVQVTGNLDAYFSQPGLRNTLSFEWVEVQPKEPLFTEKDLDLEQVQESGNVLDVNISEDDRITVNSAVLQALKQTGAAIAFTNDEVTMNVPVNGLPMGESLKFIMEDVTDQFTNAVGPVFNFDITTAEGKKVAFTEPVTLSFIVPSIENPEALTVVYINDQGNYEIISSTYEKREDGQYLVQASVAHFSLYGVFADDNSAKADEINVSLIDGKENKVHSLARNLKINVSTMIENYSKELNGTKDFIVSVQLIDKHGRVQFSHIDVTMVASGSNETFTSELVVPPNHNGQRYTLEVTVYEGVNVTDLDQNKKLVEKKIK
ncbi:5'-nucleotidase C-terminal domain-containing protein [Alkalihalobacterium elongatum]|uniref:5'-nucleotidase C-terminal domain-containing protein n=1 Tax=Alkalihalobacterium elongatum TaxID=2675466 RepID=UPI001C1FDA94|nr:5'-nucleotidase C-terminal domain-containing protein [Alkalihalobacterium elongatum]